MILPYEGNFKRKFYTYIWNVSEMLGIKLGRFAPKVFEKALGIKGKGVKK